LIKRKQRAILELEWDIRFFENCYNARGLQTKIDDYRSLLGKEKKKEEKADSKKVNDYSYVIAESEKLKQNYEAMKKTVADLEKYIDLLKK